MSKPNYRREMDDIIDGLQKAGVRKRLLLHACCAPCSSYCLELLTQFFDVTVFFYNPNLTEQEEYGRRLAEEKRLIGLFNKKIAAEETAEEKARTANAGAEARGAVRTAIKILEGFYNPDAFFAIAKGLEGEPEGGERCKRCFALRLDETARVAKEQGFDYFTTSLTISPLKNADVLNETGRAAGEKHDVSFLPSDFKKKEGYKRSIELSKECNLYRQDYCGCVYSKAKRSLSYSKRH